MNPRVLAAVIGTAGAIVVALIGFAAGGDESDSATNGGEAGPPASAAAPSDPPRGNEPSASDEPAPPNRTEPVITISPDSGERGDRATVTGAGFRPGERVRITWGRYASTGKVLRDVDADESGAFTTEVTIPSKTTNDYHTEGSSTVIATGLTSEREADTYYLLTPP